MGKTSYKNTKQLITELSEKLDQLNEGKLDLEGVNELVEYGRDLYEQLIVLRYKAFDTHGEPIVKELEKPEEKEVIIEEPKEINISEVPEETPFDFTSFSEKEDEKETEQQPSFDFSVNPEEDEQEEIEETTEEIQEEEEEEVVVVETPEEPSFSDSSPESDDQTLHSVLKKDEGEPSLRKQLQNSAVSDIKTHISIAKKFEYISNMFGGEASEYDEAIDFLNTCATGRDAQLKLNEYATKHKWNLEDKSIINFIELVERRYL